MTGKKWAVVEKSDGYLVFEDDSGLQFALNNSAKNAVFHAQLNHGVRPNSTAVVQRNVGGH